jgi:hypothetical protein
MRILRPKKLCRTYKERSCAGCKQKILYKAEQIIYRGLHYHPPCVNLGPKWGEMSK